MKNEPFPSQTLAVPANPVPLVVLADANVFFSPRMRDIFMHLHEHGVIRLAWTKEIEQEWFRNVVEKQNADAKKLQLCVDGMRQAVEGWEVEDYKQHETRFAAVDPKDRHVAAAAYQLSLDSWPGEAVALVTKNLDDFPVDAFLNTEVVRLSPDKFLTDLYAQKPSDVLAVLEFSRQKLATPRLDHTKYVAVLVKNDCPRLAERMALQWGVPCPKRRKDGTLFYEEDSTGT
jgi:hypothetical protein